MLAERREFVLLTAKGLTDDQARATPTVSSLSIGGLIKHLAATEALAADVVPALRTVIGRLTASVR